MERPSIEGEGGVGRRFEPAYDRFGLAIAIDNVQRMGYAGFARSRRSQ